MTWKEVDDTVEVLTAHLFRELQHRRGLLEYDGIGYWMKGDNMESNISCLSKQPIWATHVSWYNR